MLNGRPDHSLISSSASAEEAAAIVAALGRFMRVTAPAAQAPPETIDAWRRVAALEAVEREAGDDPSHPWINT